MPSDRFRTTPLQDTHMHIECKWFGAAVSGSVGWRQPAAVKAPNLEGKVAEVDAFGGERVGQLGRRLRPAG